MKKIALEFIRRGLTVCGLGPIVLAVVYLILQQRGAAEVLSVGEVCTGIFSLSALVFCAGGMNVVYQIERLPLMTAILIHGTVLYFGYLGTYLLNDWLDRGLTPVLTFSAIFIVAYLAIWAVIYTVIRSKTKRLNQMLRQKQIDSSTAAPKTQ